DYAPAPPDEFEDQPTGADLITDPGLIRRWFPYLAPDTVGLLHVRRCGWFSGQQLGMYLFERSREHGVTIVNARVEAIDTAGGRVRAVAVQGRDGARTIWTPRVVVATGPFLQPVGRLVGAELPVYSERHLKIAFGDEIGAIPRDAPMLIWADPVRPGWADAERAELLGAEPRR